MEMREVGSMREVGRCLFPKSDLIIKRLLFLRSKALHGGLGRVAGGGGWRGGEGHGRRFALGFLQPAQQNETLGCEASVIARRVAKLEGQKFTACVSGRRRLAVGAVWARGGGCVSPERKRGNKGCWR